MKTLAAIQARLGSSRLPRKVLLPMPDGRPLLAWVHERVSLTPGVDQVVVATIPADGPEIAAAVPDALVFSEETDAMRAFRARTGQNDVLGRFALCAERFHADRILRVTGDCPLWCPEVGKAVIADPWICDCMPYTMSTADTTCSGWPDGLDAEVFSAKAVGTAQSVVVWDRDRMHPTRLMRRMWAVSVISNIYGDFQSWPDLSVDTEADHQRVYRAAARLLEMPEAERHTVAALARAVAACGILDAGPSSITSRDSGATG